MRRAAIAGLLVGSVVACAASTTRRANRGEPEGDEDDAASAPAASGPGRDAAAASSGGRGGAGGSGPEAGAEPRAAGVNDASVDAGARPAFDAGPPPDAAPSRPGGVCVSRSQATPAACRVADPVPFTPRACTSMGSELCDDFESGAIDPRLWTAHHNGASMLTVDSEHVHSGKLALHAKMVPGTTLQAFLRTTVPFPANNNTFYTRLFVYPYPDLDVPDGSKHTALVRMDGRNATGRDISSEVGWEIRKSLFANSLYFGQGGSPFSEYPQFSYYRFEGKRWFCLEVLTDGHSDTLVRRVWLDGVEFPEVGTSRTAPAPAPRFNQISIGVWQYWPSYVLSDAWFDDIRISSQPIGCEH